MYLGTGYSYKYFLIFFTKLCGNKEVYDLEFRYKSEMLECLKQYLMQNGILQLVLIGAQFVGWLVLDF